MGWTCMPRNGRTVEDIIKSVCRPHKVLDIAVVKLRTAYIACDIEGTGVAALVFLLEFNRNGEYDFCYKDMDESMGPVECSCPERILKLLTAEPVGYAKEWREKCWNSIERRKKILLRKSFKLQSPTRFSDGVERQRFVHYKYNKFKCLDTNTIVKISDQALKNITFE